MKESSLACLHLSHLATLLFAFGRQPRPAPLTTVCIRVSVPYPLSGQSGHLGPGRDPARAAEREAAAHNGPGLPGPAGREAAADARRADAGAGAAAETAKRGELGGSITRPRDKAADNLGPCAAPAGVMTLH